MLNDTSDELLNISSYKIKKKKTDIALKENNLHKIFAPSYLFQKYNNSLDYYLEKSPKLLNSDKKIIISNLPNNSIFDKSEFINFLTNIIKLPIGNKYFYHEEQKFIILETGSNDVIDALLKIDGIKFKNKFIKIRRPFEYDLLTTTNNLQQFHNNKKLQQQYPNSQNVFKYSTQITTINYVKITGIPLIIEEEFMFDILNKFGQIKNFCFNKNYSNCLNYCEVNYLKTDSILKISKFDIYINNNKLGISVNNNVVSCDDNKKLYFSYEIGSFKVNNKNIKIDLDNYTNKIQIKLNNVTEETALKLKNIISNFGEIKSFIININNITCEFYCIEAAIAAKSYLNNSTFLNNKLIINYLNN